LILSQDFAVKAAVLILKGAMAVILGVMAIGFILYIAGASSYAEALHAAAVKLILFSPLAVIAVLSVTFAIKREFFMALAGLLLLLLLLSEAFQKVFEL
jgi:hypothetical protein